MTSNESEIDSINDYADFDGVRVKAMLRRAHARGREEGLEEAAKVALRYDPDGCGVIAAAIRSRLTQKEEA